MITVYVDSVNPDSRRGKSVRRSGQRETEGVDDGLEGGVYGLYSRRVPVIDGSFLGILYEAADVCAVTVVRCICARTKFSAGRRSRASTYVVMTSLGSSESATPKILTPSEGVRRSSL